MSPRNPASSKTRQPLPDAIEDALSSVPSAETEPEPIDAPAAVATAEPPKPKPPKQKTAPPKPSALLTSEIDREKKLAIAREELAFYRHRLLSEGGELSANEMRMYQTGFPRSATESQAVWQAEWVKHLKHENARVERVINLQAAAGTPADQTRADKLAESTAAQLDAESPAIEDEIRELQAKLESLSRAATDAKSAAIARHAATNSLQKKELLPSYIVDELDSLIQKHGRSFHHELQQLEGRQVSLVSLIALDVDESPEVVKNHIGGNSRFGADHIERLKSAFTFSTEQRPGGVAHRFGNLRPGVWESYCQELGEELATVEARMAEIANGEQATAAAEVAKLLAFYVPG